MLKAIACWAGIIGAILVAFKIGFGFVLFLISSMCWSQYGRLHDDFELVMMNMVFNIINIIGIFNWIVL